MIYRLVRKWVGGYRLERRPSEHDRIEGASEEFVPPMWLPTQVPLRPFLIADPETHTVIAKSEVAEIERKLDLLEGFLKRSRAGKKAAQTRGFEVKS